MYNVKQIIEELADKYDNAIPVFCSALRAYDYAEKGDIKNFITYLPHVITEAKFRNWHEGSVGALNRFCRICLIDPALIEAYLGITFKELVQK